jgi:hypothetical protein
MSDDEGYAPAAQMLICFIFPACVQKNTDADDRCQVSIDNEAWGVAWVALHPGILESLVFLLSALVLPIAMVGIFGWECLKSAKEQHAHIFCFSF